ncbi:MAG: hypothetical protein R6W92_15875 [Desulfocurvibacter africanus]
MHPSEILFQLMPRKDDFAHPKKLRSIPEQLKVTAFFPGGYGLYLGNSHMDELNKPPSFPREEVMVLGNNFDNVSNYYELKRLHEEKRGRVVDNSNTWRNIKGKFDNAGIDLAGCFFY